MIDPLAARESLESPRKPLKPGGFRAGNRGPSKVMQAKYVGKITPTAALTDIPPKSAGKERVLKFQNVWNVEAPCKMSFFYTMPRSHAFRLTKRNQH